MDSPKTVSDPATSTTKSHGDSESSSSDQVPTPQGQPRIARFLVDVVVVLAAGAASLVFFEMLSVFVPGGDATYGYAGKPPIYAVFLALLGAAVVMVLVARWRFRWLLRDDDDK